MRFIARSILFSLLYLPPMTVLASESNNNGKAGEWFFVTGMRVTHETGISETKDSDTVLDPVLYASYEKHKSKFWTKVKSWGVDYSATNSTLLGLGVKFVDGRKESDDVAYLGLGRIKNTAALNLDFDYLLTEDLTVRNRLTMAGADRDLAYTLAAMYEIPAPSSRVDAELIANLDFASEKKMMTEFGVSQVQESNSGYRAYEPDGGFLSVGLSLKVEYQVKGPFFTFAEINYERFGNSKSNSPFIEDNYEAQAMVGLSVLFPFRR